MISSAREAKPYQKLLESAACDSRMRKSTPAKLQSTLATHGGVTADDFGMAESSTRRRAKLQLRSKVFGGRLKVDRSDFFFSFGRSAFSADRSVLFFFFFSNPAV